jgi:hypothetical protein
MKPYQNQSRFKDNVRFFAKRDPALARAVEAARPSTRLVVDDAGAFNIDVGGGLLYPNGAKLSAERQVEDYLIKPFRFHLTPDRLRDACVVLNHFHEKMTERMAGFERAPTHGPFGGFLVVFGAGLGQHVRILAEKMDFNTLIVVEPHDEFIAHSFHVMDWAGLAQSLARTGRKLHLVRRHDTFSNIIGIMRDHDYPLLDGSYYYFHYQMPELSELGQRLLVGCTDLAMTAGWVEDQLLMLRNNHANFAAGGFYVQRTKVAQARRLPAVVVGSGPSLDANFEDLKRIRDRVVLISASSSIRALLDNGLVPDIHCELENVPVLAEMARRNAARHDLSGIWLYASPTVDPGLPVLYKGAAYYFRTGLSSTEFYGRGADHTFVCDPTSGNAALYCAVSLGFREIYLFGLDFGTKLEERQHSRHTIYEAEDDKALLSTTTPYALDKTAPGNFGGEVKTGWLLDWARNSAGKAIHLVPGVKVFNCSDGVVIQGAAPLDGAVVDPPATGVTSAQEVAQALAALEFAQAPRDDEEGFQALGQCMRDFLDQCCDIWSAPLAGPTAQSAILGPVRRTIADLADLDVKRRAAYGVLVGHVQSMLCNAFHQASTLADSQAAAGLATIQAVMVEGFKALASPIDDLFGPVGR